MSSLRRSRDSEDKIVVELVVEPTSGRILRGDELGCVRARGTRQNLPLRPAALASGTGTITAQTPPADEPARGPVRDPVAVLRNYPVSTIDREDQDAQSRQTLRAPSRGPHLDDKIRLAHLALDLYRELETSQGHACGSDREPAHACVDMRCQARADALRGALVEACLLVQRIAMMAPELTRHDEVAERLRALLAAIHE